MTWFHLRRSDHARKSHEHDFQSHVLGAGLSRRICLTCGLVSLRVVPMQCWAKTAAGTRCRAYSLKSALGPVCLAHAHAAIDWRQAVLDNLALRFQAPSPEAGPTLVIELDKTPAWGQHDSRSRPVLLSA